MDLLRLAVACFGALCFALDNIINRLLFRKGLFFFHLDFFGRFFRGLFLACLIFPTQAGENDNVDADETDGE